MLSLSNQYSYEEIIKFDANICKDLKKNLDIEYCVEPKIDGISISLIYENGILKHAITRGDGKFGEDILENVKTIRNIPLNLNVDHKRLEIRGEIFMSIDVFNELNKNLQGNEKFSNPRNAASGAVKNLNSSVTATRKLEMLAYSIPDDNTIEKMNIITQFDVLNKLKEFGFKTPSNTSIVIGAKGIIDYIEKIKNIKNNFIFPMDGIVIKVNNINLYESIGTTSKFPK
jgi:DNA ligase (NAD+)